MTWGGIVAAAFLAVVVFFVLRGIRGHTRSGNAEGGLDRIGNSWIDGL